jgi:quinoprotein glucose dehydrogenase
MVHNHGNQIEGAKGLELSTVRHQRGFGYWWAMALGVIMVALGILIGAGGIWLLFLGGSWYYLVAGIGLIISGVLLAQHRRVGVAVYCVTWLITLVWAYFEVGFNGWALVPRDLAPTIVLIAVLLTLPTLRRGQQNFQRTETFASVAAALVLLGTGGVGIHMLARGQARAQDAGAQPAPTAQPPASPSPTSGTQLGQPTTVASGKPAPKEIAATGEKVSTAPTQKLAVGTDWPAYGGTDLATRFSPLNQITTQNVAQLKKVWTFHTGDMPDKNAKDKYSPENTPIKVGDHLFVCSAKDIVISINAATGKQDWRYDPKVSDNAIPYGATCRGVAYYQVPDAPQNQLCATRIIESTLDARLIAVDAKSGKLCSDFGAKGSVDLMQGIGESAPGWYAVDAPPVIVRGIVVVGAQVKDLEATEGPSGVIRGYDAVTGKLAWAWDMGHPDRQGEPPQGQTYTRGTPNMWTEPAADPELGYVYLPLGNTSVDYWGGNRKPFEKEYSSSLVAVDVTTGKPVWHFQTVHFDVWDYDLGSQPSLVDFPSDHGNVPALILPSKTGQIFVLDRRTGKPLFPVEERNVPGGGVEPQNMSKTQPYSTYAHLDEPRLTERDMWGMSPIDQLWCRIQFRRAVYQGEYTPPTASKPFIEYPSYNGGSDWGSVAVDAKDGILVANYNDMANFDQLVTRKQADKMGLLPIDKRPPGKALPEDYAPQAGAPYAMYVNAGWKLPTGLLCTQPPYGHIRAIDLKTGKTLWDHPFGSAVKDGPFGIPSMLPIRIGTPNNGGPIMTAGGLIFIAATTDDLFRAINAKTGKVLWQTSLPGGGQTTPITYEADGRQYVVIAPGGHHFMHTKVSDAVVAYALPKQ